MTTKIDSPQAIAVAAFEDAYGYWAKRWELVARVRLEFSDAREPMYLTPVEFKALPKDVQNIIFQAPSSWPSEVLPTAQVATDPDSLEPLRFGSA